MALWTCGARYQLFVARSFDDHRLRSSQHLGESAPSIARNVVSLSRPPRRTNRRAPIARSGSGESGSSLAATVYDWTPSLCCCSLFNGPFECQNVVRQRETLSGLIDKLQSCRKPLGAGLSLCT